MTVLRLIVLPVLMALMLTALLPSPVLADNYIRKNGSIIAQFSGNGCIRINGSIEGEMDGTYIRKHGSIVGQIDGGYIRKNGSIIGQMDGDYLRYNGSILYEIESSGYVRKSGSIYLQVDGYDGSEHMKKMIAAFLFFFDR